MNNIREVEKEAAMLHWSMRSINIGYRALISQLFKPPSLYNEVEELKERLANIEYVVSKQMIPKK